MKKLLNRVYQNFTPYTAVVLIVFVVILVSLVKHQKISQNHQYIRLEVTGKDWTNNLSQQQGYRPPHWLVSSLKIGDAELSPDGRKIAELVDIDYYQSSDGSAQVFLSIKLETVSSFSSGTTVYKGAAVEIGQPLELRLGNVFVRGQVVGIAENDDFVPEKKLLVSGIYRDVPDYILEKFHDELSVVNPFTGQQYAKVTSFRRMPASGLLTVQRNNREDFVLGRLPNSSSLEVKIELVVQEALGEYYFSGQQAVKIGEPLTLYFSGLTVGPLEVTNVETVDLATEE